MQPLAIVEPFDVLKDRLAGRGPILELPMSDQLILERTEEALDRGVVVAVALAAQAQNDAPTREQRLIQGGRVLFALVTKKVWGQA